MGPTNTQEAGTMTHAPDLDAAREACRVIQREAVKAARIADAIQAAEDAMNQIQQQPTQELRDEWTRRADSLWQTVCELEAQS